MNDFSLKFLELDNDFKRILLFVSKICNVADVFITFLNSDMHIIQFKIGLEGVANPNEIYCFNHLITDNRDLIVSNVQCDSRFQSIDSMEFYKFFAGFTINIPSKLSVFGAICLLNKDAKELTSIELQVLKESVVQIESLLELYFKNQALQEVMIQRNDQFQLLIENSKDIFFQLDLNGNFTFVSQNSTSLLGHSSEEILGKNFNRFIHKDDVDSYFGFLNSISGKKKDKRELVYRVLHKNGHYVWHSSKVRLLENKDGTFYTGVAREITEYVEAQDKLIQQKEFYEKILDRLPTDVAVFGNDFKYKYLNPAAIKNDELRKFIIGKDDFEYARYTERDDTFAINRRIKFEEAIETKQTVSWEDSINAKSGQIVYHSRKVTPVFDEDGTLEMLIGFGVDVTKSKEIQEEILRSRQLISSIIQNIAVGILVQGQQSEIIESNKAACEMLGLTQDQLLGRTTFNEDWGVFHLDGTNFKPEDDPVQKVIEQLKPMNNIVMGIHRPLTNDLVWLLVDAVPIFGSNEELLYVVCSFNDITDQKMVDDALKTSNERFLVVDS